MSESNNTTKRSYNILGCNVIATVPIDADTYDKYAGRIGACVETALSYAMARTYHAKVRNGVVAQLKTLGHEPEDGESQEKFVARLRDSGKVTVDDLQSIAVTVAGGIDSLGCLAGTERAAIGQQWLDAAKAAQVLWQSGQKVAAESLAKWQAADASISVTDFTDTEQVARAMRAFKAAQANDLV